LPFGKRSDSPTQSPVHLRCTPVHKDALRIWGLCIGIGIAIETDYDTDSDSDPRSFLDCSREFLKQRAKRPQRKIIHKRKSEGGSGKWVPVAGRDLGLKDS
jgi:hypothetical protein